MLRTHRNKIATLRLIQTGGIALLSCSLIQCANTADSDPSTTRTTLQSFSAGDIQVEIRDESPWENNHVKPRLIVRNFGTETLSDFELHFYFSVDAGKTPVVEDWHTPNSVPRLEDLGGGLMRLVYDFDGFSLAPGATTPDEGGSVVGLHYSDWSEWNREDDFSLDGVDSDFSPTDGVVVVDGDGNIVAGSPPGFTLGPIFDGALGLSYLDSSKNIDQTNGNFGQVIAETGVLVAGEPAYKDLPSQSLRVDRADANPTARAVRTLNDIDYAERNSQLASIFYIQKPYAVDVAGGQTAEDAVQDWFDAGVRIVQLAYDTDDNDRLGPSKYGGGANDIGGLTDLGRDVVDAMFERYMLVDASHMNKESTMEIAALGKAAGRPVTLNHTNALSVFVDWTDRNHDDEEICRIADTGGIIGLMPVGLYVSPAPPAGSFRDTRELIEHIEYVRTLDCTPYTGPIDMINHISVASDSGIDGWDSNDTKDVQFYLNAEMAAPNRWYTLAQILHDEYDYQESDLRKLMGENLHRVYLETLPGLRKMSVDPVQVVPGPFGLALVGFSWGEAAAQNTQSARYSLFVYQKLNGTWTSVAEQRDLDRLATFMLLSWGQEYRFYIRAENDQEIAPGEGNLWVNSGWNYFSP